MNWLNEIVFFSLENLSKYLRMRIGVFGEILALENSRKFKKIQ